MVLIKFDFILKRLKGLSKNIKRSSHLFHSTMLSSRLRPVYSGIKSLVSGANQLLNVELLTNLYNAEQNIVSNVQAVEANIENLLDITDTKEETKKPKKKGKKE